jgi:hypothetical protein
MFHAQDDADGAQVRRHIVGHRNRCRHKLQRLLQRRGRLLLAHFARQHKEGKLPDRPSRACIQLLVSHVAPAQLSCPLALVAGLVLVAAVAVTVAVAVAVVVVLGRLLVYLAIFVFVVIASVVAQPLLVDGVLLPALSAAQAALGVGRRSGETVTVANVTSAAAAAATAAAAAAAAAAVSAAAAIARVLLRLVAHGRAATGPAPARGGVRVLASGAVTAQLQPVERAMRRCSSALGARFSPHRIKAHGSG